MIQTMFSFTFQYTKLPTETKAEIRRPLFHTLIFVQFSNLQRTREYVQFEEQQFASTDFDFIGIADRWCMRQPSTFIVICYLRPNKSIHVHVKTKITIKCECDRRSCAELSVFERKFDQSETLENENEKRRRKKTVTRSPIVVLSLPAFAYATITQQQATFLFENRI